jgi:hypothetical protein
VCVSCLWTELTRKESRSLYKQRPCFINLSFLKIFFTVRFEVLTVISVRLYGLQKCDTVGFIRWVPKCDRNLLCPASTLMMEIVGSSQTLTPVIQTM